MTENIDQRLGYSCSTEECPNTATCRINSVPYCEECGLENENEVTQTTTAQTMQGTVWDVQYSWRDEPKTWKMLLNTGTSNYQSYGGTDEKADSGVG